MLLVWFNGRISPGTVGVDAAIDVLVIAVVGGIRHPIGPFVGAVVFVLLKTFAIDLVGAERFNTLIGRCFLAIVFVSPDGLLGLVAAAQAAVSARAVRCGRDRRARCDEPAIQSTGRRNEMRINRSLNAGLALARGAVSAAAGAGRRHHQDRPARHLRRAVHRARRGRRARRRDWRSKEHNGKAGGKKIEIVKGSSDASPDSAVNAARKLVEQDGVKILVGPLSGDEGLAVKDYAKTQPNVTFINGTSAAQDTTLRDPAPNFFRFSTDGAQWMAGLGDYAFKNKGYKKVVTVAEDYSFPYTQVFGFMAEFCKAGGHVPSKSWVPIGNKDFSSVIAAIPDDVDAIYVALGGADARQLPDPVPAGRRLCAADRRLDHRRPDGAERPRASCATSLIGTPSAGPIADTWDDAGLEGVRRGLQEAARTASRRPSLFAHGYYIDTKAVLLALDKVRRRHLRRRRRSCARRWRTSPSTRRPARSSSTRTATPSPTSS